MLPVLTRFKVMIATFKPAKPVPVPGHPVTPAAANAALAEAMRFDKALIGGSLFLDLLSHSLVTLSPTDYGPYSGQALFVGATTLSCFGAGLMPAVNSLALCIMQSRGETDTGKMFGAFSLLQAIGQAVAGVRSSHSCSFTLPRLTDFRTKQMIFAVIYSKTVATYPKAIFVVAGSMVLASIVVLLLLRPDALVHPRRKGRRVAGSLSALEARVETQRGRSRKSKDLRQPSLDFNFHGMQIPPELLAARGKLRPMGGHSYGATSSHSGSSFACTPSSSSHPVMGSRHGK